MTTAAAARRSATGAAEAALLAVVTFVPLLLGNRGRLNADTKQYLYLDPVELMDRSRSLWDSSVGGGAVTHQAIGYLWPMGPFYALTDALGVPDWAAQRLWVGGLQFVAALGALALFRHLLPRVPGWTSSVHVAAAAAYGLSPYILGHVTNQSGLLVPFAGLPWLVLLMARAVESPRSWRWPAAFALAVTTCGSLNGSSVFFVVLAAVAWVPFARPSRRDGLRVLIRTGALTLLTQLWWLVAYAIGGAHNLPILEITETVRTTNATTSATEVLRGLGHWFFYGDDTGVPWLDGLSTPYMTSPALLMVSFGVPIVALTAGAALRWRHRSYFALLIGLGTVLAVGAFPVDDPSPAGWLFERFSRSSDLVLSLRNTQRAAPLVALGLAGLLVGGLAALTRRHVRLAAGAALALLVLVSGAIPAQWRTGFVNPRSDRGEIPDAWYEAADHLDDAGEGRVLELPGSPFADHRWGSTHDPVSVGLSDREFLVRELVPLGSAAGADLLTALDRSLQEGWFEPDSLVPVSRLLGVSDVLVRNDLAYERSRTPRPRAYWPFFEDLAAALGMPRTFGGPYDNRAPAERPLIDEIELGIEPTPEPPPQLAVFDIPRGARRPLTVEPLGGGTVVDGDGEGIVSAAAAGLLGTEGVLLLGADVVARDDLVAVTDATTRFVLTDSNRKRANRWYGLRENVGATEPADGGVSEDTAGDLRLEPAGTTPPGTQTVVRWEGAERIWASSYGGFASFAPEERPFHAFDGDPSTAWRTELGPDGERRRIGIDLGRDVSASTLTLVPPQGRYGTVAIERARVTLDGDRTVDVQFPVATASSPDGQVVQLDGRPFSTVEVELVQTAPPGGLGGLAEIQIPGVEVDEMVTLPTAVTDLLGHDVSSQPLAIVLTRLRADPAEIVRDDPETAIRRAFRLPATIAVGVHGASRLDPNAPEPRLDALLGAGPDVWPVSVRSTARLAGDLDARASSVLDGDESTAWQTPLSDVIGQAIRITTQEPVTMDVLELDVLDDGQHSVPRRVRVSAGDAAAEVDLPVPTATETGVHHVSVPLPRALSGTEWELEILEIDERTTIDRQTRLPFTLPVGVAELALPGVPLRPDGDVDTGCRDDLLEIDGEPVRVRVEGSVEDAHLGLPLDLSACGDRLALPAGAHEVHATPGRATGIDLDRVVLRTPAWADAPATPTAGSRAEVRSEGPGRVTGTVETDGAPFWLLLDESMNEGWELEVEGAAVAGPRPLDSSAAGWLVTPAAAGSLVVEAHWTPQRVVDSALALSGFGAVLCLALVVFGGRRPTTDGPAAGDAATRAAPALGVSHAPPSVLAVAVGVVSAGILVSPAAALPAGVILVAARRWPWLGRIAPMLLVGGATAAVTILQIRHGYTPTFPWPTQFGWTHGAALLGVVLLAVSAVFPDTGPDADRGS